MRTAPTPPAATHSGRHRTIERIALETGNYDEEDPCPCSVARVNNDLGAVGFFISTPDAAYLRPALSFYTIIGATLANGGTGGDSTPTIHRISAGSRIDLSPAPAHDVVDRSRSIDGCQRLCAVPRGRISLNTARSTRSGRTQTGHDQGAGPTPIKDSAPPGRWRRCGATALPEPRPVLTAGIVAIQPKHRR